MLTETVGDGPGDSICGRDGIDDILKGDGVVIIPYVEVNGARIIPDDMIEALWEKGIAEALDTKVFGEKKTFWEFLDMLKSNKNLSLFMFKENGKSPLGIAWINGLTRTHAFAHFMFLKEAWGMHTMPLGRACCRYWFALGSPDPILDILVGNIPSSNRAAIRFVQRLGWTVVGEIPHLAYDGAMTVTYCERDTWAEM